MTTELLLFIQGILGILLANFVNDHNNFASVAVSLFMGFIVTKWRRIVKPEGGG